MDGYVGFADEGGIHIKRKTWGWAEERIEEIPVRDDADED
jgi:hypothetical protein